MKYKILKSKKKGIGFIVQIIAFFLIFALFLIIYTVSTIYRLNNEHDMIKDSLTLANLAPFNQPNLNLDLLSEYPDENVIMIKDPYSALQTWETTLEDNLKLDESFKPMNSSSFIKSKVDIKNFIIYNVNAETKDVTEYTLNPSTMLFDSEDYPNGEGVVKTPSGTILNITTIYSTIGFTINIYSNTDRYGTVTEEDGTYKAINNTNLGGNN